MGGINDFIRGASAKSLTFSVIQGHSEKMAVYKARNGCSSDTKSAGALSLDFCFQNHEKQIYVVCKPPVYAILLWKPMLRQVVKEDSSKERLLKPRIMQ